MATIDAKVTDWKVDPITGHLVAPLGKAVRGITTLQADDAASAQYVLDQIAAIVPGEVNTGSNVGGAAEVFKQKVLDALEFRTLTGVGGIVVSQLADVVQLDGSGIGSKFSDYFKNAAVGSTAAGVYTTIDSVTFNAVPAGDFWIDIAAAGDFIGSNSDFGLRFQIDGVPVALIESQTPNTAAGTSASLVTIEELAGYGGGNVLVELQAFQTGGTTAGVQQWTARLQEK